jgi:hypothetical protein
MPTELYECAHVPIKGAKLAVKHPVPTAVAAFAIIVVYVTYGIWPFILLDALVVAALIAFAMMLNKSKERPPKVSRVRSSDVPSCIRHPDVVAVNIYRFHLPSGEIKDIPICGSCIPEFTAWLAQKQLTSE